MSSSEEEETVVCSSVKKRKSRISSSEDDDDTPVPTVQVATRDMVDKTPSSDLKLKQRHRSSERITRRRNRSFTMPSRDEIWKDIPSVKSPAKAIRDLKPRKLVNNYTKERNSYNREPLYTSDEEESMSDFIDDNTDSSTGEIPSLQQKPPKHRIRHRHTRVSVQSDTSSDTEPEPTRNRVLDEQETTGNGISDEQETTGNGISDEQETTGNGICISDEQVTTKQEDTNVDNLEKHTGKDVHELPTCQLKDKNTCVHKKQDTDSSDDDSRGVGGFSKSSRRQVTNLLDDSESESGLVKRRNVVSGRKCSDTSHSNSSDENELSFTRVNRSNIIDSDEEVSNLHEGKYDANKTSTDNSRGGTCDTNADDAPSTSSQIITENDKNKSTEHDERRKSSDDSNSECSSDSDIKATPGRKRARLQKQKNEKQKLFETFRKARRKRLSKSQSDDL